MAEYTYKGVMFTAVISWDIGQITDASDGVVLADIDIKKYKPSIMDINENYRFRHGGSHYSFTIPKDIRHRLATRLLLGGTANLTLPMKYCSDIFK